MTTRLDEAERARIRRWDLAVGTWVAASLALAVWTGVEIASLRSLTDTLSTSSQALTTTADALASLDGVPVVGDDIGNVAGRIRETASSAARSAADGRRTIGQLAGLVAVAIFTLSTVPPVVAYLTIRRSWRTTPAGRHAAGD